MRAVWIGVPESFLAERHRLGHDKKDELWEGVLHMVPPPSRMHGSVTHELGQALDRIAKRRGLVVDETQPGLFGTESNWRIPDVVVAHPSHESKRGFEGADLVVEVLSPDDESREKFPFFAQVGVREVWLIEPSNRATEVFALVDGRYVRVPFVEGVARSPVLGIELRVANDRLELRDGNDHAVI